MKGLLQIFAISIVGMLPGDKSAALKPTDGWDDLFLDGDVYKIGFLTLCGDPLFWNDKKIEVIGYAKSALGSGLELSVLPDEESFFPAECKIGVSIGEDVAKARQITKKIGDAGWALVKIKGKFVAVGTKGNPPHLGAMYESSVTILKLKNNN